MSIFVAGLDLGQAQDYSALVILEVAGDKSWGGGNETLPFEQIDVRHIERFPLQTKYQEVARLVEDRLRCTPAPRYLSVDCTGVGAGVIEMLLHLNPGRVIITGGNDVQFGDRPQEFRVPKRDLVGVLSVALQNGVLRIASGLPQAELLTGELANFRTKISISGHDTYEAWRTADHDDLVLATGIGIWYSELIFKGRMQQIQEAEQWRQMAEINRRVRISPY
jgi:hypothetical protein